MAPTASHPGMLADHGRAELSGLSPDAPGIWTGSRPVWAEISAARLRANYAALRTAAEMEVLAVVKADAYGHGAALCAPVLAGAGAGWLGVTSVAEGVAVRAALGILPQGMVPRVLVMCGFWPGEEQPLLERGLTPVVWELFHLQLLTAEARRRGLPPRSIAVHLEIDTGMTRQGVAPGAPLRALLEHFQASSPLLLEGVMTHLASTECVDDPHNAEQMNSFRAALAQIADAGFSPSLVHAGNTSSTDSAFIPAPLQAVAEAVGARPMTRAGLALYGYALPLETFGQQPPQPHLQPDLRPVLTWKSAVVSLREVPAGTAVGYNGTFVTVRASRLALLPVGYADGVRRSLSSSTYHEGGAVLLRGRRVPITGRVSMDLTVVDITDVPGVALGDEAVLLGEQGMEHIGADEHARLAGTTAYEILCGLHDRVPRIVVD